MVETTAANIVSSTVHDLTQGFASASDTNARLERQAVAKYGDKVSVARNRHGLFAKRGVQSHAEQSHYGSGLDQVNKTAKLLHKANQTIDSYSLSK